MKNCFVSLMVLLMSLAVMGYAEEQGVEKISEDGAEAKVTSFEQVEARLLAIEKRLKDMEKKIGKSVPGSVTMSTMYKDIKDLEGDVRDASREASRAMSTARDAERRRR